MREPDDHRDARGWVVNPFEHLDDTGEVESCHVFSVEPGCSRGGHSHPGRNEEILVLAGRLEVRYGDRSAVLGTAEIRILEVEPGMPHSLHNRWGETAVAICWSSRSKAVYTGPDTVRHGVPNPGETR
jgi:quercetin dioxygenase-like cupin family protein